MSKYHAENFQDGGTIAIGVKEKAGIFTPIGVSAANEKTHKIDLMRILMCDFTSLIPKPM